MNKNSFKYLFFLFLTAVLLPACLVRRPYKSANVKTDNLFRDVNNSDTNSIAQLKWSQLFNDTILQRLIARGIDSNLDLRIAYTRIQQAEAYYRQSVAAYFPDLNANAGVTRSRLPEAQRLGGNNYVTQYQIGATSSWEADIWGRLKSSERASLASLLQSVAGARAVQTDLVGDIANFYYLLLALDQQLAITQQTITNWDTTVKTMRYLKEAARVTEAAVVQSEAQRYAAEVTIPDLKQRIRETENALSILLAMPPLAIRRSSLEYQQTPDVLKTGVPAQLLANRPDVQAAEYNYRFFFEQTNIARTFFYPIFSITGSAAFSSLSVKDLFDPASFAASIGAGLTQPIFNRRLNRTRLEVARAQQQEAALGFQNTLLNAGREVSDALYSYETANEKVQVRSNQLRALQLSVNYTQELLRNGFANYTEVIQARQSLLQAELGRVDDRLQQLQAVVNLYRSLGGGWR